MPYLPPVRYSTSVTMASYALGAPCHDPEILSHGAGIDAWIKRALRFFSFLMCPGNTEHPKSSTTHAGKVMLTPGNS